jgi:hypothetical protein
MFDSIPQVNNAYRALAHDEPLEIQVPDPSVERQRNATPSSPSRAMSSSSSEKSSFFSNSVIHIAASSAESLITPPSSQTESVRPSWKQGQRKGPMDQYQRSAEPPNRSRMPAPSADFRRRPSAHQSHDLAIATSDGQEQTVPVARNPQNLRNVTGPHRRWLLACCYSFDLMLLSPFVACPSLSCHPVHPCGRPHWISR